MVNRKIKPAIPEEVYPANLTVERAVLRSLVSDDAAMIDILSHVVPDDFTDSNHQLVYRIVAELFQKKDPVDLVTVSIAYQKSGAKGLVIADLFKDEFVGNVHAHIKAIKDLSRRRRVQTAIMLASENIRGATPVDEVVAELMTALNQSTDESVKRPIPLSQVVTLSMKRIEKAMQRGSIVEIPSGFARFDEKIGGFHKGDLIIVADRPGGGKSALLACIAIGAAKQGFPSMIVNAEMETIDVGTRMLAGASGVENFNLRAGKVEDYEVPEIVKASGFLSPLPIWVYDDRRWEIIKAQVRAMKMARPDLAMVLIDYVTRIDIEEKPGELRYQAIGRISKQAKDLGQSLGLAVIIAAQITRASRKENKEPVIEDLRECGDLEQDADIVSFIHRYHPDKSPWEAYWLIKKNRNGPLGNIKLRWVGGRVSFYDWEDE